MDNNYTPCRSTLTNHVNYKDCHQNSNSEQMLGKTKETTGALQLESVGTDETYWQKINWDSR